LLTGRYHQVRVMLSGLGIPLVGDPLYGDSLHGDAQCGERLPNHLRHRVRKQDTIKGPRSGTGDYYIEHILLKFVDYANHLPRIAHLRDDPDRGPIHPELAETISALSREH